MADEIGTMGGFEEGKELVLMLNFTSNCTYY